MAGHKHKAGEFPTGLGGKLHQPVAALKSQTPEPPVPNVVKPKQSPVPDYNLQPWDMQLFIQMKLYVKSYCFTRQLGIAADDCHSKDI